MSFNKLNIYYLAIIHLHQSDIRLDYTFNTENLSIILNETERIIHKSTKAIEEIKIKQKNKSSSMTGNKIFYIFYSPNLLYIAFTENSFSEDKIFSCFDEIFKASSNQNEYDENKVIKIIDKYQISEEYILSLEDKEQPKVDKHKNSSSTRFSQELTAPLFMQDTDEEIKLKRIREREMENVGWWKKYKWKVFLVIVILLLALVIILPILS